MEAEEKKRKDWRTIPVRVRGQSRAMHFRVEGPYLRDGLVDQPLFLMMVRGMDRRIGDSYSLNSGSRRPSGTIALSITPIPGGVSGLRPLAAHQ